MKQTRLFLVILVILFLLCSCTRQREAAGNADTTASEATNSLTEIPDETELSEVLEYPVAEGFITPESKQNNTPCSIRLTKARGNGDVYDLCIEIDTGTKMLKKELTTDVLPLILPSTFFFADVDGDGTEDILIHYDTGGCGGFGSWLSWVLTVKNDEIRILFQNDGTFDTGFESHFLEGYQLEVKNRFTGYTVTYDVRDRYGAYIDGSDELPNTSFMVDPFYVFEPNDVDKDGISEILCKQYTSIRSHADYNGSACSVLKFNQDTQAFEVVDAWYEPNAEE